MGRAPSLAQQATQRRLDAPVEGCLGAALAWAAADQAGAHTQQASV